MYVYLELKTYQSYWMPPMNITMAQHPSDLDLSSEVFKNLKCMCELMHIYNLRTDRCVIYKILKFHLKVVNTLDLIQRFQRVLR